MSLHVFPPFLQRLAQGADLTREETARAVQVMMNGGATPAQMGAFLMALAVKGETAEELTGAVEAVRTKSAPFPSAPDTLDVCGTGGDRKSTLNISTAVAFVTAACGVKIAKHGNRAVSSSSGSADVLEAMGVKIDAEAGVMAQALERANLCFLLAPKYHAAMRHVAPVRQELGIRTLFNLVGPLCNPAKPSRQVVGVFDAKWLSPIAHALRELGATRAWVVHGTDGMDELSLCAPSRVAELKEGEITQFTITPDMAGLEPCAPDALSGGDAQHNAQALRELLLGHRTPYRDAVVLNTAAALIVAERAATLPEAATIAQDAIDSGAAYKTLQQLIEISHARAS